MVTKVNSHQCLLWTAQLKSQNFVVFSHLCLVWTSQFGVSGFPFRVRHLGSKAPLFFFSFGRGSMFPSWREKTSGPPRRHFGKVTNSHSWWGMLNHVLTKCNSYQHLPWTSQLKSQNFVVFSRLWSFRILVFLCSP